MVAALLFFLAASTPATSDFANRIVSIEQRTGARIGAAGLDLAALNASIIDRFPQGSGYGIRCLNFADARIACWI
jgi:hypothetical protein